MPLKAYWAYAFTCDQPLESILAVFNQAGSWKWECRESHSYGDYLNTRPIDGVRVRIHIQESPPGSKYSGLLQIEPDSTAERQEIDDTFRALLVQIDARDLAEIEPYD